MAGTTISALGKRSLFATFLTPKNFLFRSFIVSSSIRHAPPRPSPQHVRHGSGCQWKNDTCDDQIIKHRDSRFAEQLWRAKVTKWKVEDARFIPNTVKELQLVTQNATQNASSSEPVELCSEERMKSEDSFVSKVYPHLFSNVFQETDRFHTGHDERWVGQPPLCPELQTCRALPKQLSSVQPDHFHGFYAEPWAKRWPLASKHLDKMMSPTECSAFPFYINESKGIKGEKRDARKQILHATALAIRNLRYLHTKSQA